MPLPPQPPIQLLLALSVFFYLVDVGGMLRHAGKKMAPESAKMAGGRMFHPPGRMWHHPPTFRHGHPSTLSMDIPQTHDLTRPVTPTGVGGYIYIYIYVYIYKYIYIYISINVVQVPGPESSPCGRCDPQRGTGLRRSTLCPAVVTRSGAGLRRSTLCPKPGLAEI